MSESQSLIGIAVVDDNELIGDSVSRWLRQAQGYQFHGSFTSTEAALAGLRGVEPSPRIVVLDVDIPGSDTFAAISRFGAEFPNSRVVMLSGHVEPSYIARALDLGAAGYIVKDEGIPNIVSLIQRAANGEVVLSLSAKRSLATLT